MMTTVVVDPGFQIDLSFFTDKINCLYFHDYPSPTHMYTHNVIITKDQLTICIGELYIATG